MRKGVIWSAALHVLVLVLVAVGLPRLWDTDRLVDTPMVVEVVNIDEVTTAKEPPKPAAKEEPKKKAPPPPEPPKAKPETAQPPPAPPKIAERPEPKAEAVPEKPKPEPKPEPKKAPEKKKEEKKEVKPPAPPRAVAEARPKRKPLAPKEDFLDSVLRDVSPEKRSPSPSKEPEKPTESQSAKQQREAQLDAVVTTSEIDAIRHAIEQCWAIPAGARDVENLIVSIRVWVNPDGMVRNARIDRDLARLGSDPFFRAAAESAMRAVLNQRCQPLPIPPNKYDQFKELVLDFNPKTAAGS